MPLKAQASKSTAPAFVFGRNHVSAMLVAATFVFSTTATTQAAAPPQLTINGSPARALEAEHSRLVFVPAQSVFSQLGESVTYRAPLAIVKTADGTELARLTLGSNQASLKGAPRKLAAVPFAAHGALMVPLRFVSEAAGATVTYSTSPRSIRIQKSLRAAAAGATVAAAPAAVVAQANPAPQVTDAATAAPAAATQADSGIPWWVWLLAAFVILGLVGLVLAIMRRKKEPLITTRRTARSSSPNITTRK